MMNLKRSRQLLNKMSAEWHKLNQCEFGCSASVIDRTGLNVSSVVMLNKEQEYLLQEHNFLKTSKTLEVCTFVALVIVMNFVY
jgi:hypothetical protein